MKVNVCSMRRTLGCLFLLCSTAAGAQTPEAKLLQFEDQLFAADVHHDAAVIQRGFADEAIFVHANGMTQTKADYIRATENGAGPVHSISTQNRVVKQ